MTVSDVTNLHNASPEELQEWLEALSSVVEFNSPQAAQEILDRLLEKAQSLGVGVKGGSVYTPFLNTIPAAAEAKMPDPLDEEKIQLLIDYMRWNTICLVMRGRKVSPSIGGHIGTYCSTAPLFEIGFNYFWRANHDRKGDVVYLQGHAAEGVYARSYMEGRITEDQMNKFRQEVVAGKGKGLSSYPHPYLMPDYWENATVCLGLGPMQSIYQAHFMRYMHNRELLDTSERHVWMICGDGELDEPESLGSLHIAGREKLDNLTFVISCNLQRLDGLVWGNGQIIQEYEGLFRGAGWHVIKVVWGSGWDKLLAKDKDGVLVKRFSELVDGEYQDYSSKDGAYFRENFFGKYPELLEMVSDMSDDELKADLLTGGHDLKKVYAAYKAALEHKGQPTVILAQTVKGFGMGASGEGKNIAHNAHSVSIEDREAFSKRFNFPISEKQLENLEFMAPAKGSEEHKFLMGQREKLGGLMPHRNGESEKLSVPKLDAFAKLLEGSGDREMSSTMAFVRALGFMLRDDNIKHRIVPITSDEGRTLGMEGLFRQLGVYAPFGQKYTPEDRETLTYYREAKNGQYLQEGITETGCMSSWIAVGTSYATHNYPMIPFFAYYSMFGFQRCGDYVWSAGDQMAKGFLIGATSGRTTLSGEGLQHEDGQNYVMFGMVPSCVSYDPTYSYEMAVILQNGLYRMYEKQEHVFFYVTCMNENYLHPAMPKGAEEGILKGLYLLDESKAKHKAHVQLLGSGAILNEVRKAAEILDKQYNVAADVWSATSFNELHRDARAVNRHNSLQPEKPQTSWVKQCLSGRKGPVVAATDYVKLNAEQIRSEVEAPYYVLGTDGYGRSDDRPPLRHFFEVDASYVAYTALSALHDAGEVDLKTLKQAQKDLNIDPDKPEPVNV